jgi:hypothetical protein
VGAVSRPRPLQRIEDELAAAIRGAKRRVITIEEFNQRSRELFAQLAARDLAQRIRGRGRKTSNQRSIESYRRRRQREE